MNDIEFYIHDLGSTVESSEKDLKKVLDKTEQIRDSLRLSLELYTMSSLMEVYYAQNFDAAYLQYLQQETYSYLGRYQFFDEPYGYCFVLISPDGSEEHRLMVTESGFLLVDGVYVDEMPRFVEDGDFGSILNEEYERAQESGTLNTGFQP